MTSSPIDQLRPPSWHAAVAAGDFGALPDPLRWEATIHFALLVDGYAVAGGHAEAAALRRGILDEIGRTGTSTADALDLWAALFFSWRRLRFIWGDPTTADVALPRSALRLPAALCALDCIDIEPVRQGLPVHLRRSKTDQLGAGRDIGIPLGRTRWCPVAAFTNWLAVARITEGPVFRPVDRHGNVSADRLSGEAVCLVVRDHDADDRVLRQATPTAWDEVRT